MRDNIAGLSANLLMKPIIRTSRKTGAGLNIVDVGPADALKNFCLKVGLVVLTY